MKRFVVPLALIVAAGCGPEDRMDEQGVGSPLPERFPVEGEGSSLPEGKPLPPQGRPTGPESETLAPEDTMLRQPY
jgi:hypothetical protein